MNAPEHVIASFVYLANNHYLCHANREASVVQRIEQKFPKLLIAVRFCSEVQSDVKKSSANGAALLVFSEVGMGD